MESAIERLKEMKKLVNSTEDMKALDSAIAALNAMHEMYEMCCVTPTISEDTILNYIKNVLILL